ncbi:hypothetical protein [Paenibacillus caseinilyticus]|uniref:hypothetical protein n=1 Tax=Paenibacillus caseinilyticus TaxID=3098138 RepID=UPI0022B8857A|nr:hypothetical protein [Paenibacillus caseinilyticus]MCZ8519870.1 hypothetical protein [Paenibacillus caseinilyticus]
MNDVWLDNERDEYLVLVLNDATYFHMTWMFAMKELRASDFLCERHVYEFEIIQTTCYVKPVYLRG